MSAGYSPHLARLARLRLPELVELYNQAHPSKAGYAASMSKDQLMAALLPAKRSR